jgi:hypothetical protein
VGELLAIAGLTVCAAGLAVAIAAGFRLSGVSNPEMSSRLDSIEQEDEKDLLSRTTLPQHPARR